MHEKCGVGDFRHGKRKISSICGGLSFAFVLATFFVLLLNMLELDRSDDVVTMISFMVNLINISVHRCTVMILMHRRK